MVPGADWGMFNDLGVYGVPRAVRERRAWDAVTAMRNMEEFTRQHDAGIFHWWFMNIAQICWRLPLHVRGHVPDQRGV